MSKGTYIRSLIRDIAYDLNTYGTMKNLVRTKQGIFSLEDSYTLEDIQNDNYKLLTIREVLSNIPVTNNRERYPKESTKWYVSSHLFQFRIIITNRP